MNKWFAKVNKNKFLFYDIVKEFFEYNNVILNIPSIEKKRINKIYLNANQNENYNSFKAQNSENNIFKKKFMLMIKIAILIIKNIMIISFQD